MSPEQGVNTALERRNRCRFAAWEGHHSCVGGAWEGRHCCMGIVSEASPREGRQLPPSSTAWVRHLGLGGASLLRGIGVLSS